MAKTRIYYTLMPDGQQPTADFDVAFEAVLMAFTPEVIAERGWPVFVRDNGRRMAVNPTSVDAFEELKPAALGERESGES